MGFVSSAGMRQYRKIAVVALLCFAAVITPPDVVSQILIFFPCYALYEYGIRIAQRIEARRAKEEAAYQARLAAERAEAEKTAAEQGSDEEKQGGNNNNDNSLTDDSESQDEAGAEESADNVDEPKPAAHSYDSDMASPDELPTEVEGRKVEYEIIAVECDDATGEPIQKD